MRLFAGWLGIIVGTIYCTLGLITAVELRQRWSRFGAGFLAAAATCGPHHLIHGEHILLQGSPVDLIEMTSVLLGLAPAALFVGLRIEAMAGGRGDRQITGTPAWLAVMPLALAVAYGAVIGVGLERALTETPARLDPIVALPNLVMFGAYVAVGWYMARTQLARREAIGGWSVSGLSLAGIFGTCAFMHLAYATARMDHDWHSLLNDGLGVPASLTFLGIVYSLHRRSAPAWVSQAATLPVRPVARPAPWDAAPEPVG